MRARALTIRAKTLLSLVGLLAGFLSIMGCSPQERGAGKLQNYVSRLATASQMTVPEMPSIEIPRAPERDPQFETNAGDTLSIIDFLALSGCALQANIAKRNTTMGRTASPSQQLILDLEFLRLAPSCIQKLVSEEEDTLAQLILENTQQRSEELKITVFKAILGGDEWRQFWRAPAALGDYPENASGDVAQSLWRLSQRLEHIVSANWSEDDEALEPLLADIRVNAGGQLLLAAATQQVALARANAVLADASQAGRYCRQGRVTEAGTITKTVVTKFFAGDVQVWSAAVSQRHYEIQSAVRRIETLLADVLPNDYVTWSIERDALLASLYEAPRRHVARVQDAISEC